MSDVIAKATRAKTISKFLNGLSSAQKDTGLLAMAEALLSQQSYLIKENKKDLDHGRKNEIGQALLDRLALNPERIKGMAAGLDVLRALPDPIGEIMDGWTRPNGLRIQRRRVPIGVIGIIYEARPNVTVDASGLSLKSSNATVLRGSSSAINSNIAIVKVLNEALQKCGFPKQTINLIEDTSRETVKELVTLNGLVDLVIPRGGAGLIRTVVETATVPSIETGVGNCHVYIDASAKIEDALAIAVNAKTHRPSVCNAAETILVHQAIAQQIMPKLVTAFHEQDVEIFGCPRAREYDEFMAIAREQEYATEFLDYKVALKIVDSVDEAVEHIDQFGSHHTEAIVSEDFSAIETFKTAVDAAAVIVNASTRFTDGFEFGFGAEIGISTQKIHARGPMGLRELTTYKYIVEGQGQIRK